MNSSEETNRGKDHLCLGYYSLACSSRKVIVVRGKFHEPFHLQMTLLQARERRNERGKK
jgi:hypothetical protein